MMALAASVKMNTTIRCLDLSIPANDPEFARLSQDILQSCIRNTELAQEQSTVKGTKVPIAAPIYKSGLARNLKELEKGGTAETVLASLPQVWRDVAIKAKECTNILGELVGMDEERRKRGEPLESADIVNIMREQGIAAETQLVKNLANMPNGEQKDSVGIVSSQLAILLQRAANLYEFSDTTLTKSPTRLAILPDAARMLAPNTPILSPNSPNKPLSSPSFSITSSDDSDSESVGHRTSSLDGKHTPPISPRKTRRPPNLEIPAQIPAQLSSSPKSPVESQSRVLTLEEGEVFRRGASKVGQDGNKTLLDVLDDDEAGEELKQEILDITVKRTRRNSVSSIDSELFTRD